MNSALAIRLALLAAVVFAGAPQSLLAASGVIDTLPAPNPQTGQATVSPRSKLIVTVDTNWTDGFGYRPVRFKFESPKPGVSDRSITVRFYAHDWRSDRVITSVEGDLDFPSGALNKTLTLAVPKNRTWNLVSWDVWVDGVLDVSLSRPRDQFLAQHAIEEGAINALAPVERPFASKWQDYTNRQQVQSDDSGHVPLDVIAHPLPEWWLLYSGLDIVRLSADELATLARDEPKKFAALRQWVSSGGTLWLEDAGPEFERLGQINTLLRLEDAPHLQPDSLFDEPEVDKAVVGDAPSGANPGGPQSPAAKSDRQLLPPPFPETPLWNWVALPWRNPEEGFDFGRQQLEQRAARRPNRRASRAKNWFLVANLGFGRVAAYRANWDKQISGFYPNSTRAFASYWTGATWPERHGMEPDSATHNFSNLLIPDVGLAPVTLFRVLITLFVLVAGPLNYWILTRRQRTQLMVLTVPLTALLLTASLFAYALLADGFGVRIRARSITLLDQPSQSQTVWSRNTYYAGMAPSEGLSFPATTAVYPILPGWNDMSAVGAYDRERSIQWEPDKQQLSRGWLASRETTQLLTVGVDTSKVRVDFTRSSAGLRATNHLGADLTLLIVLDENREFWLAEALAAEATVALDKSAHNKASIALRTLITENLPSLPVGLDTSDNPLIEEQQRLTQRRMREEVGVEYAPSSLRDNRMNELIDQLTGANGGYPLNLPSRSFVAVSATTVAAPMGLEDAEESSSFHIVLGRW